MQEQNFEKQVQQKMEELNLTPSTPVWQRVEQEIRKKKDRRRLVLWVFLFLFLVGGTATWMIMDQPFADSTASAPLDNGNENTLTEEKEINKETTSTIDNNKNEQPESTDQNQQPDVIKTKEAEDVSSNNNLLITRQRVDRSIITNNTVKRRNNNTSASSVKQGGIKKKDQSLVNENDPKPDVINPDPVVTNTKPMDPKTTEPIISKPGATDSINKTAEKSKTEQKQLTDTATKKEEKKKEAEVIVKKDEKNNKRWILGIHAGAGISNVYSDLFTQTLVADNMSNSPGPGPGTGSGFGPPPPSKLEAGLSYSAGISLKKELNDRFSFVTGLQYTMFSTKHTVGQEMRRDTTLYQGNTNLSVSNYYRNDVYSSTQSAYTNKYHFIELPLGIEYKPLKNFPLSLGAGLSIARMLSTNALVYDRTAGIYYEDNGNLNKTQLHAQGNISYTVWKHKKFSLSAGPYIQTGISSLVKNDKDRLFAAGLKTNISF